MDEREPVLQSWHISKRFGAVQALVDVELEVYAGEVVGLVSDNGAGKSTLIKIIAGVHRPDSDEYRFNGRQVSVGSPREVTSLGIETVYQDLALCDNLDVVANVFRGASESTPLCRGWCGSSTRSAWSGRRSMSLRICASISPWYALVSRRSQADSASLSQSPAR